MAVARTQEDRLQALEAKVAAMEERQEGRYQAHESLLRITTNELERQNRVLSGLDADQEKALRASHHDIEVGMELQVAQLRVELTNQMAALAVDRQRAVVSQTYLRKENRALFGGIAGLLLVAFVLFKVDVKAEAAVALVAGLLVPIGLFLQQMSKMQKDEKKARESIVPPPPPRGGFE